MFKFRKSFNLIFRQIACFKFQKDGECVCAGDTIWNAETETCEEPPVIYVSSAVGNSLASAALAMFAVLA